MTGGYDLYGHYYPNINDANMAEMSQCNEIDNRINSQRLDKLERQSSPIKIPDDVRYFISKIASSDECLYREEAKKLTRKYFK